VFKISEELQELYDAIDAAPVPVPCTNFPDAFFPKNGAESFELQPMARKLCAGCPVLQQCASYAIRNERFGIWGGMTEGGRQRIRTKLGIRLPTETLL